MRYILYVVYYILYIVYYIFIIYYILYIIYYILYIIPECVARVPVSLWGFWGLRVCSLDVAFTVATVRNRSQPFARGPYGRAYGKFCRGGHFWWFRTCRCFVSRGRRGTL